MRKNYRHQGRAGWRNPKRQNFSSTPSKLINGKKFSVEEAAKTSAFLAIILYVIGLITTNIYLSGLGLSEFSLIRTRFVLTGVLVVASLFMCIALPILACVIFHRKFEIPSPKVEFSKSQGGFHKLINWSIKQFLRGTNIFLKICKLILLLCKGILILVCVLLPGMAFLYAFSRDINPARNLQDLANSFFLYVVGLFTIFLIVLLWNVIFVDKTSKPVEKGQVSIFLGFVIMFLLIQYILLFTQNIYPRVPEEFGGGAPIKVQRLFAKDQSEQIVKQLGIPTCNSNGSLSLSQPIVLLFEGSEAYILLINNRVIKIDKKMAVAEIPILEKTSHGLIKYLQEQKNIQGGKLTKPNQAPSLSANSTSNQNQSNSPSPSANLSSTSLDNCVKQQTAVSFKFKQRK